MQRCPASRFALLPSLLDLPLKSTYYSCSSSDLPSRHACMTRPSGHRPLLPSLAFINPQARPTSVRSLCLFLPCSVRVLFLALFSLRLCCVLAFVSLSPLTLRLRSVVYPLWCLRKKNPINVTISYYALRVQVVDLSSAAGWRGSCSMDHCTSPSWRPWGCPTPAGQAARRLSSSARSSDRAPSSRSRCFHFILILRCQTR
jgi:hypothetical protein